MLLKPLDLHQNIKIVKIYDTLGTETCALLDKYSFPQKKWQIPTDKKTYHSYLLSRYKMYQPTSCSKNTLHFE